MGTTSAGKCQFKIAGLAVGSGALWSCGFWARVDLQQNLHGTNPFMILFVLRTSSDVLLDCKFSGCGRATGAGRLRWGLKSSRIRCNFRDIRSGDLEN